MSDSTVNSQIVDAVEQTGKLLDGMGPAFGKAVGYQVAAHAVGLAMQNAVAQQQRNYILRNALLAAAVRGIQEASPEEALAKAEAILRQDDTASVLEDLTTLMERVGETLEGSGTAAASASPKAGKARRRSKTKAD